MRDSAATQQVGVGGRELSIAGRQAEDRVAVDEEVGGPNGAGEPVVGGLRQPAGLRSGQRGVGGDHADRGVHRWRRSAAGSDGDRVRPHGPLGGGGSAKARRRHPRQPGRGVDHRARRVDHRQRRDRDRLSIDLDRDRRHADPALHAARASTGARSDGTAATRRRARGRDAARAPNSAVGRLPNRPPRPRSKITAVGTTGTTWAGSGPTGTPEAALLEVRHDPVGRRQPVGATAREAHRVDAVDQVAGIESIGLACARDRRRGRRPRRPLRMVRARPWFRSASPGRRAGSARPGGR